MVPERLSDAALIEAVRRGDTEAYGLLYERHLAAANRAASYLVTTTAEREDLVAEAFTRVLQVLRAGRGPAHDFRPYLLVTMRHAAINAARRSPTTSLFAELPDAYLSNATDDPVEARLTGNDAASAFAGLPERWRQVLWHTEVEGASPAAIAPMLGMTPNGVAALAYRAREGLRQAYLRTHLPAVDRRECREATDKLAGWVRQSISEPQHRKISAHLSRCQRCRELAAGLREVNGEMRSGIGPLIMSWLSVLKSALSATTVKVGAAAAIAAVTAVSVVASDLPGGSPDGGADAAAGPGTGLRGPAKSTAGNLVKTPTSEDHSAPDGQADRVEPVVAAASVAEQGGGRHRAPEKPAPKSEPAQGAPAKPAKATGKHAKNEDVKPAQAAGKAHPPANPGWPVNDPDHTVGNNPR